MKWVGLFAIVTVVLLGVGVVYLIANIGKPDW